MNLDIFYSTTQVLKYIFLYTTGTFIVAMLLTPLMTAILYKNKCWKKSRENAISGEKAVLLNKLHEHKHRDNIPTMAGVLIWLVVGIITLLFNFSRSGTYLPLFTLLTFGILGFFDDLIGIRGGSRVAGLRHTWKFFWLILLALIGGLWFYFKLDWTIIHIPIGNMFGLPYNIDLGYWYIPFFVLVIISCANAVNITDGLDGLAGGLLTIAFGVYIFIALVLGKPELAIFCATIVGAVLAYTWFNIHPARFFMGDTGALALGATLGVVAMLTNTALVLPIIGFVFVVDTLSVLLQLFWKKFFKKKILPITPLHHTFELLGWHETKVTMRLWIIGAVFGSIGLVIALLTSF